MPTAGFLATSFAARRGVDHRGANNLANHLPPLLASGSDFRIDLTPLLLHGRIVMNSDSFQFLTCNTYSKSQFLARQLADFYEAGLVELKQFATFNADQEVALQAEIQDALGPRRSFWLDELRKTVTWWEQQREKYKDVYGDEYEKEAVVPWAISATLEHSNLPWTKRNISRSRRALFADATEEDRELVNVALAALVNYTCCNRLNAIRFSAPVFDWEDMHGFMTAPDRIAAAHHSHKLNTARFIVQQLAKIDAHDLTNNQIIAMLKDSRVEHFRRYVDLCVERGSASLYKEQENFFKALLDHRTKVERRREAHVLTRVVPTTLLQIGGAFLGSAKDIADWSQTAIEGVEHFLNSAASEIDESHAAQQFQAIYALSRHTT